MRGGILTIGIILLIFGIFLYFSGNNMVQQVEAYDVYDIPFSEVIKGLSSSARAQYDTGKSLVMFGSIFGIVGFIVCVAGIMASKEKIGNKWNERKSRGKAGCEKCGELKNVSEMYLYNIDGNELHLCEKCGKLIDKKSGKTDSDEDFGADACYDDENPKTLESHWDLLMSSGSSKNLHRLSVAYRGRGDMTIWVDGRLDNIGRTPRLEYEWEDLVDSESQNAPDSDELESGNEGTSYNYDFTSIDMDGNDIAYDIVDWGDDTRKSANTLLLQLVENHSNIFTFLRHMLRL